MIKSVVICHAILIGFKKSRAELRRTSYAGETTAVQLPQGETAPRSPGRGAPLMTTF